jgi:transcriptional regulator with XRE-family HTH domain
VPRQPHPTEPLALCLALRALRKASGRSLTAAANLHGLPVVVLSSYESGRRMPSLARAVAMWADYGYRLDPVPDSTSPTATLVACLRAAATQLEQAGRGES